MLRDNTKLPIENVNLLFDDGGLGDNIARLSVVKYIRDTYKHVILHVYVPDYFLDLAKHLVPYVNFYNFSVGKTNWNKNFACKKTSNDHHTNMKTHLVDNAFHILSDSSVDIKHKEYVKLRPKKIDITKFNLPKNYVILTTGFTANVRELRASIVNELATYIIKKGCTPVFLGSKTAKVGAESIGAHTDVRDITGNFNKEIDYTKGIDLINKTSLLEAAKIISNSKALVGLDNGLMHVAGTTEVPIIGAYTTVESKYRLPYRHGCLGWNCYVIEPPESLKCRFCQSNWEFVYNHDYRNCYYKEKGYDTEIQCVKSLNSIKFIEQLEKVL